MRSRLLRLLRHWGAARVCLAFALATTTPTTAEAGTATIGGRIWAGSPDGFGPNLSPGPEHSISADDGVRVMVERMGDGVFVAYGSVVGNSWTATVPTPDADGSFEEYVVMYSAPRFDLTSRAFRVVSGDALTKDAFLAPLPLPSANLLVYSFEDLYVNGEDDFPDDPGLAGVTFELLDSDSNVVATGVSGTQSLAQMPLGVGPDMDGLYYFTVDVSPTPYVVEAGYLEAAWI